MLNPTEKQLLQMTIRQGLYFIGAFVVMGVQFWLSRVFHEHTFDEFMWAENLQAGLLVFSCAMFAWNGIRHTSTSFRPLCFLLASGCALAVFRELDSLMDNVIPLVSWRVGFLFVAAAVAYAFRHLPDCRKTLLPFTGMPAFHMMVCSLIVIVAIAQLVGHKPFLRNVLVEFDHVGPIKELFEESVETIGYYCLACASVELLFDIRATPLALASEGPFPHEASKDIHISHP
jgi:hypothetical protein